jgi:hypothetical protein
MGQSQKGQPKGGKSSSKGGITKGNKSNSVSNVFIFLAIFSTIVSIIIFIKNMMGSSQPIE